MIRRGKKLIPGSLLGAGIVITLVTGLLFSQSDGFSQSYGFPFLWREVPSSTLGPVNWFTFLVDVSFYMALGYVVVNAYEQKRGLPETYPAGGWFGLAAGWVVAAIVFYLLLNYGL